MSLAQIGLTLLAQLPQFISVNTPTQAVTLKYNYALHEGQIYWRANPDYARSCRCTPRGPGTWAKLELLAPDIAPGFDLTQKEFVAIAADDHEIMAQTDKGQLWRSDHGKWSALWGMPLPIKIGGRPLQDTISVPKYSTALALSVRNKDVLYYEDPSGNQFHWGSAGCTTVLALHEDGKRLSMGDPWFPPDLSRQICGPDRGSVRMASVASSASTTMVLAQDGRVFTRFFDYDSNGGTPFFKYVYHDVPKHGIPGQERKSEFEARGLPAEDWIKHPVLPIAQGARLSKRIAILQNGIGNGARELRVQAQNESGENGYYFMQLGDDQWKFRVTDETIRDEDFLELVQARLAPRDRAYKGLFIQSNKKGRREVRRKESLLARIESSDVNVHCSPFTLTFTLSSGDKFEVLVHTVDAWTAFADEDPDINPFFVKKLKATLEFPALNNEKTPKVVKDFIKKYFKHDHLNSFRWAMVLDQERAELRRVSYPFKMEDATTEQFVMRLRSGKKRNKALERLLPREELERRLAFIQQLQGALPVPLVTADFLSRITTTRYTIPAFKGLPSFEGHAASLLVANEMALKWMLKKLH
jgi:hypothetical protein